MKQLHIFQTHLANQISSIYLVTDAHRENIKENVAAQVLLTS